MKPTPAATQSGASWARFAVPAAWMLAIYLASDQPKLPAPEGVPGFDKIAHFGAYGLLATLWVRALSARLSPGRAAFFAWSIAALFGVTDEFHQSFVPGRSTELADWLADSGGAALAVLLYTFWPAYRGLLDRPIAGRRGASPAGTTAAVVAPVATERHS
ncbi:MAG: VanZ family protein [Opitutaceae bacterium]|nr:VanZ family protein [Opitutaceae bacterium]